MSGTPRVTKLFSGLQAALNTARKSKDKDRTLLLGTVLSAVKNHELELARPLTDDDVLTVLQRAVKQRRESVEQFHAGGRPDLADRELARSRSSRSFFPRLPVTRRFARPCVPRAKPVPARSGP